ncbi:MAG TPA: type VI secretion system contractile sheath small subunit [Rhodothermales bacterium]|nr:type VI secretion system contractile sheath small subunit [Rhodothermales bacterium]
MAQSFQKEKPPARINLFLDVVTGDAQKKIELPLRLLVMGDFTGKESGVPLEDREKINLNKDNFEDVLRSQNVEMDLVVKDTLSGGDDDDMKVNLKIDSMADFHPEQVAKQVPQLQKLLATRNLLQDLRNRIISVADFRKGLEKIVKDPEALKQLEAELAKIVPGDKPADEE